MQDMSEPATYEQIQGRLSARAPLIVIEGIDRIGKNTQADRLVLALGDRGTPAEAFSTPDYADDGNGLIQRFLHGQATVSRSVGIGFERSDDAVVLECLQICNRYAVASKISKALDAGKVAVVVRWWPSALLYGRSDGVGARWIDRACSFLPRADLSILLNVDPQQVRHRLSGRDRYEGDVGRQVELAGNYEVLWKEMAESDPCGWKIVDGSGAVSVVASQVEWEVDTFLKQWRSK
jgi:dTMP kinase